MAANRQHGVCTPTPAQYSAQNVNFIDLTDDSSPRTPQLTGQLHYSHLSTAYPVQSTPEIQQTTSLSHHQFTQGDSAMFNENMQVQQLPDNMSQQQYKQFRHLRRQREAQAALMGNGHHGLVHNGPNQLQALDTGMGMGPGTRLVCQIATPPARTLGTARNQTLSISLRGYYTNLNTS
jgi:hypothetical protein